MFTAALFTTAKLRLQPKGPLMDEGMNKLWSLHTMEYSIREQTRRVQPYEGRIV